MATQTATRPRLVVNNASKPKASPIAALIAEHKAATAAAQRAGDILAKFPEDLREEAKVQAGLLHTYDKGEPVKQPIYSYSHEGLDSELEGHGRSYKEIGGAAYKNFEALRGRLHQELSSAIAAKKAARDAAGYTKAERHVGHCHSKKWKALYALTGTTPANMAELAELARYLRLLESRNALGSYFLGRALTAMTKANS
jgi:hypothetical protein